MERAGGTSGQASSEYVALVALVAVACVLAAGLTSGGIGARVLAGLQRGLCAVAGRACPAPTPVSADLAPCPLDRATRTEAVGETIGVVRLGASGTLSATRTSDGHVAVTLSDGGASGAEIGAGARLRIGRRTLGGRVRAEVAATFMSGRAWRFPNAAAAHAFIARYGGKATIGGKLLDGVRSACSLLCDAIGWRPHPRLPEPDETYRQRGASAALAAELGAGPATAGAGGAAGRVLGSRVDRDGTRTWYVRLDHAVAVGLGLAFAGVSASARSEQIASYTVDGRGRPLRFATKSVTEARADGRLGVLPDPAGAQIAAGRALVVERDATLDLRDPVNRAAAHGVLELLLHPSVAAVVALRGAQLVRRIAEAGELDRRTYALSDAATGVGAGVALGVELAGGFDRTTERLRLLSAETRLPGLPFLPRDDCRPA
jgi:hypothetical protein